jgi:hypothetical protein
MVSKLVNKTLIIPHLFPVFRRIENYSRRKIEYDCLKTKIDQG